MKSRKPNTPRMMVIPAGMELEDSDDDEDMWISYPPRKDSGGQTFQQGPSRDTEKGNLAWAGPSASHGDNLARAGPSTNSSIQNAQSLEQNLSSTDKTPQRLGPKAQEACAKPKSNSDENGYDGNQNEKMRKYHGLVVPDDDFRVAVINGNLAMVKSLVEQGLPVNTVLKTGWTGLMFACNYGHAVIARYLLDEKADPHYHFERFTSVMAVCSSKSREDENLLKCLDYLIEVGADVDSAERHHMTPLMFAAREGKSKLVKRLIESGADVNRIDNRDWTALVWAIDKGHGDVVRVLLDANAQTNVLKSSGQTLVEFAYDLGHNAIGSLLEKFAKKEALPEPCELAADVESSAEEQPFTRKGLCVTLSGDLEAFLLGLQLYHLLPVFHAHDLTFAEVLRLSDADLQKIGISQLGTRRRMLKGIRDVHRKDWEDSSLPNRDEIFTCPDAVCMVANISKHLTYIQSTIAFLKNRIETTPRILELGQEVNNVRNLLGGVDDAIKNNHHLQEELGFFRLHLDKVQHNVAYIPAGLISEKKTSDSGRVGHWKSYRTFGFVAAAFFVGITLFGITWKKPISLSGTLISRKI